MTPIFPIKNILKTKLQKSNLTIAMDMINKLLEKYYNKSVATRAAVWFMFSNVVQKGIITLTTPIFSRLLTQEEYGIVSIYNSWMGIFTLLATFALTTGVISKAMIKYKDSRWQYISSILVLTSIVTVFFFVCVLTIKRLAPYSIELDSSLLIIMGTDIFFSSALALWSIKNRFEFNYKSIVPMTIVSNSIGTILSLIFVIWCPQQRVFFRIFGNVITHIVLYAPIFVYILRKGKTYVYRDYWLYSLKYNAPLIPHYLSQQALNQADRIMISSLSGNAAAAVYSLAYQVAIAIRIVVDSIFSSFDPWALQHIEKRELKTIGVRAFQMELFLGIICCGFSLFAPEMIAVMGGEKYASAAYIVPPITMSVLFIALYSMFSSIEFYYEKTKMIMTASCAVGALNILLNWFFINAFGFAAAAYTTLFCYVIYAAIHYVFMVHICRLNNIENPFSFIKMWGAALVFVFLSMSISLAYSLYLVRYMIILALIVIAFAVYKKIILHR